MSTATKQQLAKIKEKRAREEQLTEEEKALEMENATSELEVALYKEMNATQLELFKMTGNLGESAMDPLRETNFTREEQIRVKRLEAMTKPEAFNTQREAAFKELGETISKVYYDTFKRYAAAGHPSKTCKQKALDAAQTQKDYGMDAIESEFGSTEIKMANQKEIAQVQAANAGMGMVLDGF